jgi:hypothetical protein
MATPLIPQEVFLLERYSSVDYFANMRDAWSKMIRHAERCLDAFVHSLPPDYRKRELPYQPDVVWGELVLVNFRDTLSGLDEAFIRITHGDFAALSYANGVSNDFAGLTRDYSCEWMNEPNVAKVIANGADTFWEWLMKATENASNIKATWGAYWRLGDLSEHFHAPARGPLNPPAQWPSYRENPRIRYTTGQIVTHSGIYLPDCNDSVAALLIEGRQAPPANVGYDPQTMQRVSQASTRWTLVERVADTNGGQPEASDPMLAGVRLRASAGEPCPREGWWFTPAKADSRRRFTAGDTMPALGGDYGLTIWQWDPQQD